MKTYLLLGVIVLVLLVLPIASGQIFSVSDDGVHQKQPVAARINVTMINQDPDPVEPGETVEVRFKIESSLGETKNDVIIELLPQYPFSLYQSDSIVNIGKLRGRQVGSDAVIVDYTLLVDENAVEGEQEIPLQIQIAKGLTQVFDDKEFLIDIETQDAILKIEKVSVTPENILPGETGNISFRLVNEDDTGLKNIHVKLNLNDVPVLPYQSTNEQWIKRLSGGYTKQMHFPIIIDPAGEGGQYKIPVEISFTDIRATKLNKSDIITVGVGGKPTIRTYVRDQDVYEPGKNGRIVVEIANPSPLDVKFLELELHKSATYTLLSANKYVYIGDIDSDDTESETFQIHLEKDNKKVVIPVTVRYQDPNNNMYVDEIELVLNTFSRRQLVAYGMIKRSSIPLLILIIALAGVGYWWWRRRKKKKQPQK